MESLGRISITGDNEEVIFIEFTFLQDRKFLLVLTETHYRSFVVIREECVYKRED